MGAEATTLPADPTRAVAEVRALAEPAGAAHLSDDELHLRHAQLVGWLRGLILEAEVTAGPDLVGYVGGDEVGEGVGLPAEVPEQIVEGDHPVGRSHLVDDR